MKLTITISDIDPGDLERLSSALANPELWLATGLANISDDEAQKATSAYETRRDKTMDDAYREALQNDRVAEPRMSMEELRAATPQADEMIERHKANAEAIDLAGGQPAEPAGIEPDRSDAAKAGISAEKERREFIAACDAKWKRSRTLQVGGTTKTVDEEVMDAETGEVLVLRILYRGRAVVENEAGEWRLVDAKQLKLTGEETAAAETPPADEPEEVISVDALRALAQRVVSTNGPRVVKDLFTKHCGQPLQAKDVPVHLRAPLAEALRAQLT
jgi:hypothetical protein